MNRLIKKANVLIESLPYIRAFRGKTVVVKYGGHAMTDTSLKERFAQNVVLLKYVGINPVIIHGGGPQIDKMLDRLGIEAKFRHGVRVTDEATMEIVEMVLAGQINMEITDLINRHGGSAVGLSGKDGGLILSKPLTAKAWAESLDRDWDDKDDDGDFGLVGDIERVDPSLLHKLQGDHYIPIIAPIGTDREGNTYNINADLVAGAIAGALRAEKLVMMTDIKGIRDAKGHHLSTVSRKDVQRMVKKGTITEGMLPKVHACLDAIDAGVGKAHIIDGRIPHAILLEIFTRKGIGTEIVA
ncbi:MAG: acetylglutamate kinase [Nitrospiraceae bacterium]|jgi:acetylglutamate kinase|uniref:acetylglutamate kinase n=1 Tax=Nitrospira cf. moscoviensis SBR1015 TaxID=96242 RepID=UPI000A0D8622|nr:acetylglutamate kinase [Nitrospira cf. moscoviensis SBR1015]MBY0248117.1 acetylglutamate kinase [Nitrospiraceae bacterium]OQW31443.1 MAG: acetylglutamate kinase [Nitrospira sp. SG-bin2]